VDARLPGAVIQGYSWIVDEPQVRPPRLSTNAATALVFLSACLFLYWTTAHRFVLSYDEGIFLDGARRILEGQAPYRDFFILMGPASFWFQAAALKLFGLTLAASRIVVILDLSTIAACVYQFVARRTRPALGAFVAALCIVLETAEPVVALPNHRWDSAALATLAVTILSANARGPWLWVAGACAALAAWATPTVLLVGLALALCIFLRDRANLWRFCAGAGLVSLAAGCTLAMQGALLPMLHQMLWTGSNYNGPNWVPYGGGLGGYADLFKDIHGVEWVARGLIVSGMTLPVLLPPLALLFAWLSRRTSEWMIPCVGALALLATAYPRFDLPHLTYVAPLFYALLAAGIAAAPYPRIKLPAFLLASLLLTIFAPYTILRRTSEQEFSSNVGLLRASGDDVILLRSLQNQIPRDSNLFVFPYLPVAYFLTLSHNPTRYSYLQPGMMSDLDEKIALQGLQASPPERVVYYDFTEAQILHLWPNSDPSRLRLRQIESYLATQYRKKDFFSYRGSEVQILERIPGALARN
jgi:hypothetical protein